MQSGDPKFSFRNLQPINYLNQFNRMVDYTKRHPGQSSARSELNLIPLNKFPISKYYEDMEGIFQNLVRKKQDQGNPQRSRQTLQDQRFMEKHNEFMRKVLTKFIIHNEERMSIFEREKKKARNNRNNYQTNSNNNNQPKNHLRSLSEPKLLKKTDPKPLELPEIATIKPETPNAPKPSIIKDFRTHPEIVNLQLKQAKKQSSFAQKIEQQISKFDKEMQTQVQTILQFRGWQPTEVDELTPAKKDKKQQISQAIEFEFNLKNFATN